MGLGMKLPDCFRLRVFLISLACLSAFGIFILFILLGCDVFTLPYLTPVAHVIGYIIKPFVPLFAPLSLGIFIKVYRSTEIKQLANRRSLLFTWGSQLFAHIGRVLGDVMKLYIVPEGRRGMAGGWCPVGKCSLEYVQTGLIIGVVLAELMGLKWDGGYIDQFIHNLAEQERKKKETEGMEEGVAKAEEDTNEKKVVEGEQALAG